MKLLVHVPDIIQNEGRPIVPLLRPFYDLPPLDKTFPWSQGSVFANYINNAENYFELAPANQADIVIFPFDWCWVRGFSWRERDDQEAKRRFIELYRSVEGSGKSISAFFSGDRSCEKIPLDNATLFRQSAYKSRAESKSCFAFPAFVEDFVASYLSNEPVLREKSPVPVVSFCGLANPPNITSHIKSVVYLIDTLIRLGHTDVVPAKGENLRSRILRTVTDSSLVKSSFIVRDQNLFIGADDTNSKVKLREEFIGNVLESDYVLCCRGSGNYSYRLYETLSLGRIPIIIDTDIALPFDDLIDWKQHAIWVSERDIDLLPEIVAEFHERITPAQFKELQEENRRLWQTWLSPEGFFGNFFRFFQS